MKRINHILTVFLFSSTFAAAKEAQKESPELSFAHIREALRTSPAQKEMEDRLNNLGEKSYEARINSEGLLEAELEGTRGVGDNKESKFGVSLMKPFVWGRSLDTWRESYNAQAKAQQLEAVGQLNEQMKQLGEAYASLLLIQRQGKSAAKALELLKPLVATAEKGQMNGSSSGVAILKWRLLEKRIQAHHQNAVSSFRAVVQSINEILKTKFDDNLASSKPVALAHPTDHKEINFAELPAVSALKKKQESLGLRAQALDNRTEFSAGVGMERDAREKLNSVLLKLTIPLGQGSALTSEAHEARAEMGAIQNEEQRLIESLRRRERMLHGYMESKTASVSSLMTLRDEIEKIQGMVTKGLDRGLTDFAEVVEAVEKLYETELALAEAQRELDDVLVEIAVLTEEKL